MNNFFLKPFTLFEFKFAANKFGIIVSSVESSLSYWENRSIKKKDIMYTYYDITEMEFKFFYESSVKAYIREDLITFYE